MKTKFILAVILVSAILCFGGTAKAQVFDIQALIAQLKLQIVQLQMRLTDMLGQQQQSGAWCYTFNNNLKINDNNNEVMSLEEALRKEGIFSADVYSLFDDKVASAVVEFQEKYAYEILTPYGLKHGTGFVGPATRRKLNLLYGCSNVPTCSNLFWFDNTSSNQCQTTKQFCGAYMYYGLQTFGNQQDCLSAFNTARGNCTPNWKCDWGTCINGYQSQIATDSNNCGLSSLGANIACPALARQCNTAQPLITVSSPNGGEQFKIGSTYTIGWQVTGNVSGKYVKIYLTDGPTNGDVGVVDATVNTFSWTIRDNIFSGDVGRILKAGNYKIKAVLYDGRPCSPMQYGCVSPNIITQDSSDNFFGIAVSVPATACVGEGASGSRLSNALNNCCSGLQEQDYAMTNSIPGSILYHCIKPITSGKTCTSNDQCSNGTQCFVTNFCAIPSTYGSLQNPGTCQIPACSNYSGGVLPG